MDYNHQIHKLWTRDFTIITVGSIISMLGNAVCGFAMGILVLEYTSSTLLYALYFVCTSMPKILIPLVAGPILDRFSRRKAIYLLDFFSSFLFALMAAAVYLDFFNYPLFLLLAFIIGTVEGVYSVAFDSFYPDLISPGNFTKAYSINSMIYPLANTIMVPLAGIAYETVGLGPLMLFNCITFFVTAVFETFVSPSSEKRLTGETKHYNLRRYAEDFREGLRYLSGEKGLMAITAYFVVTMFSNMAFTTVLLPFFKANPNFTVTQYSFLTGIRALGRIIGGVIHYRVALPTNKKYAIAIVVYLTVCIVDGVLLFLPYGMMLPLQMLVGILGITSYNIRISATQNYVPHDKRGRFNGLFLMITTAGSLVGQLLSGVMGEFMPLEWVLALFMAINAAAVFLIMFPCKKDVKAIYNCDI